MYHLGFMCGMHVGGDMVSMNIINSNGTWSVWVKIFVSNPFPPAIIL